MNCETVYWLAIRFRAVNKRRRGVEVTYMEAVWLKKVWITLHATNSKGSRQEWLGSSPGNHYSQDYYYHQQLIFKVEIVALYLSWTLS